MSLSAASIITAVLFGGAVGWGLARNPDDLAPSLAATVATAVVGLVLAATNPSAGSDAEMAAGAMTLGGAAATMVLALVGGRPRRPAPVDADPPESPSA